MTKVATLEQAQALGIAPWNVLVWEDSMLAVFKDQFPVTRGHLLFVPKHNTINAIQDAMSQALIKGDYLVDAGECDAYNVGLNMGAAAGQTVMWPHVHLIPRRTGDCADPTGGVRGVIFGQQNYKAAGYVHPE